MAEIKFKGKAVRTIGNLPPIGVAAPDFLLTDGDLNDKGLKDFPGKRKILNIVPSLDTGVCAASARRFNQEAGALSGVVVLTISADLPFAQSRFCEAEGIENVIALSSFRSTLGKDYGVEMTDGVLRGLCSRAIVVLNEKDEVAYTEQVPEITQEPDYEKALAAVKG